MHKIQALLYAMPGIQECQESASKTIKSMADEIIKSINSKTKELRLKITAHKQKDKNERRISAEENTKILKQLEEGRRKYEARNKKRDVLQDRLEKDSTELARLENENGRLEEQLKELQMAHGILSERCAELQNKHRQLESQYSLLKHKHEEQSKMVLDENRNYRTYLGIDIVKLKNDFVKLAFNNLGTDCHVIFNFKDEPSVSSCIPDLGVEKLDFMFKEIGDFYLFVKTVREEFKKRLS